MPHTLLSHSTQTQQKTNSHIQTVWTHSNSYLNNRSHFPPLLWNSLTLFNPCIHDFAHGVFDLGSLFTPRWHYVLHCHHPRSLLASMFLLSQLWDFVILLKFFWGLCCPLAWLWIQGCRQTFHCFLQSIYKHAALITHAHNKPKRGMNYMRYTNMCVTYFKCYNIFQWEFDYKIYFKTLT